MIKSAKKRRKKKILQNNNIVPQKHERIGNLNYYSEEIAKEIIDKLISLTFTKLFSKKLDEKVSSYTIDLFNKTINNYLQLAFINYDKDDLYFSNNEMIKKKYFNSDEKRFKYKRRIKFNTRKKLLAELDLKNISNDRRKEIILKNKKISDFLSSSFEQPINNYIKSPKILFYDTKKNNDNFWGIIKQPESKFYDRMASQSNQINQITKSFNEIKEEEITIKKKSRFYTFRSHTNLFKKKSAIISKNEEIPIKTRLYKIIKMSSLKNVEEYKFKKPVESEEIIELRKQKNDELLKIKEENLKRLRTKETKIEKKGLNISNIKVNFVDKEKDRIFKDKNKYIELQIRKGNFTTDFDGNVVIINEVNPENLTKDFPSLLTRYKDVRNDKNETQKSNIDLDNIQFVSKKSNNLNKTRKKGTAFEMKYRNSLIPEYLKNKLEPSGSNFDLIQPEIGVTIHEKTKTKTGGNKFFEKYHKFSMNDFSITLKETLENERQDIKEKILENLNKTNTDLKNTKSVQEKNISNINSNTNYTINKDNNLFEKTFNNEFYIKSYTSKKKENSKGLNKSQSEILLKGKKFSLLEDLFDHDKSDTNLNYLDKKVKFDFMNGKINQKNLFQNKIKDLRKINKKNDSNSKRLIDKFNKNIISNNKNNSGIENYLGFKQIVNFPLIPLRRNRSQISMNKYYNSSSNFYRTRIKKNYK